MKKQIIIFFSLAFFSNIFGGAVFFDGVLFGPYNYTDTLPNSPLPLTAAASDGSITAQIPAFNQAFFCLYKPVNCYPIRISGTVKAVFASDINEETKICLLNGKTGEDLYASCVSASDFTDNSACAVITLSDFPETAFSTGGGKTQKKLDYSAIRGIGIISGNQDLSISTLSLNEPGVNTPALRIKPASVIINTPSNSHGILAGAAIEKNKKPSYYAGITGKKPAFFIVHTNWSEPFPLSKCLDISNYGSIPVIYWDPILSDGTAIDYEMINKGIFKDYMAEFASEAASYGKPVILCPLRNANDPNILWSLKNNKNRFSDYKEAFIRCVLALRKSNAKNILTAFGYSVLPSVSHISNPANIYPGNEYVDLLIAQAPDISSLTNTVIAASEFAKDKTLLADDFSISPGDSELLKNITALRGLSFNPEAFKKNETAETLRREIASDLFVSDPADIFSIVFPRMQPPTPTITPTVPPSLKEKPVIIAQAFSEPQINSLNDEKLPVSAELKNSIFSVAYNSSALLIYVESRIPASGNNMFKKAIKNGDSVTICLSTDPSLNKLRSKTEASDFIIHLKASDKPEGFNATLNSPLDRAKISYRTLKKGWALEAAIPWHNFMTGCLCKLSGQKTNFNLIVRSSGTAEALHGEESSESIPAEWAYIIFGGNKP